MILVKLAISKIFLTTANLQKPGAIRGCVYGKKGEGRIATYVTRIRNKIGSIYKQNYVCHRN